MYKVEWNFNENVTEYTVNCSLRAGSTFHIASSDTVANKTELQRELSWFRSCNTLECCVIPELSDSDNERENSTQCTQDIIPTGGNCTSTLSKQAIISCGIYTIQVMKAVVDSLYYQYRVFALFT